MKLHNICATLLVTITLQASDSLQQQANAPSEITCFEESLKIDLNWAKEEKNTRKTFKQLLCIAHKKHIPWIAASCLITTGSTIRIKHFDLIELIKKTANYTTNNINSKKTANQFCLDVVKNYILERYPNCNRYAYSMRHFYLDNNNEPVAIGDKKYTCFDPEIPMLSLLSCTLAIELFNDFSQLPPILCVINDPHAHKKHDSENYFLKEFWNNTYQQLPDETKTKHPLLQKKFEALFDKKRKRDNSSKN